MDRRLIRRDEQTGQLVYAADLSITYYHLSTNHIKRKNPSDDGRVFVPRARYESFNNAQN